MQIVVAAEEKQDLVNKRRCSAVGVSDMWQGKDLYTNDFGSLARKRVTVEFFECVANKGVRTIDGHAQRGMREREHPVRSRWLGTRGRRWKLANTVEDSMGMAITEPLCREREKERLEVCA